MITSELTNEARTTIPPVVLAALQMQDGDVLAYKLEKNRVILTKAQPDMNMDTTDDPFKTFSEWSSEADTQAYAGL